MVNFEDILSPDIEIQRRCLDKLVEEINEIKEKTIFNFLNDSGSEDFLWSLIKLLSFDDIRIASNAAYVIGSFAETELGAERVLSITKGKSASSIVQDLANMLVSDDSETVMNAAGTLGTLAETNDGRLWMLSQPCMDATLSQITDLLNYENNWVASNAALVIARLSIAEEGCRKLLDHEQSTHILTKLVHSLGNDSAGRGMNAAFAIGRILDMTAGKERLLNLSHTEKMISTLCRMLCKGDMGSAKNACFAVSCLAADKDGNQRVITNDLFNDVLARLVLLLANDEDVEAAWFAAMTLRTLSSHQRGVWRLRDSDAVVNALNTNLDKTNNTKELNEEIRRTIEHLKKLEAPEPPTVTLLSPYSVQVSWEKTTLKSGADVTYKLFEGSKMVYKGKETAVELDSLKPNTSYNYKLKVSALGDDSPLSGVAAITTDEGTPSPPCNLRVIGITSSQIRVTWSPPEQTNGTLKGYSVYVGEKLVQHTSDTSFIVMRLQPSTLYTIHVRAQTSKGVGDAATVEGRTHELGAHAPSKPTVTVIGRNEVHVTWNPPAVPLGRISRYELIANKDVIYSGTDRSYYATNLVPDKDYSFIVCAITSEGRCESDPTKKRTPKDKSQAEPGRHASKTHSFKAKESFQLEKSKTQSSIVVSKPKPKLKKQQAPSIRPSSCSSAPSHTSVESKMSQRPPEDGSWATGHTGSTSTDTTVGGLLPNHHPSPSNSSVVLGPNLLKVEVRPTALSGGSGNLSMFLPKSNTDLPLRLKLTEKNATNNSKYSIEPISWNDMMSSEANQVLASHVTRKQGVSKNRARPMNKLEAVEHQKSFIQLITKNGKGHGSALPRMSAIDRNGQDRVSALRTSHPLGTEGHGTRTKRRPIRKSPPSDTSSDDTPTRPKTPVKDLSRKLEPLTIDDVVAQNRLSVKMATSGKNLHFDDPKHIAECLRTPSKGYWSDNDMSYLTKKKKNELHSSYYQTFKRAHRPSKTFRQDSPLASDRWLSDLPSGGDKYSFIPTQLRTQPANLPKPNLLQGKKLDSIIQEDLRQKSMRRYIKPQRHSSYRHVTAHRPMGSHLLPRKTDTYDVNTTLFSDKHSPHAPTFPNKLVREKESDSPHHRALVTSHGDPV